VSPLGDYIVSVSDDWTLKVWDAHTGEQRLSLEGHVARVNDCAVSPDGSFIVSASNDQTLKVWNAQTGDCFATFHGDSQLITCACLPDGEHLVAGGNSGVYFLRLVR
jgi:WD40 repeat protein